MSLELLSTFLWKLKNNSAPQGNLADCELEKINYIENSIFCRLLFTEMDNSTSREDLHSNMETLCKERPTLKEWILKMYVQEDTFHKILHLNLIKEKAKPLQA